jgi:hypothetical protein
MRIADATFSFLTVNAFAFGADWAWGLPLIVLTVVIHVVGFGFVSQRAVHLASRLTEHRHSKAAFVMLMGATTLLATCLQAIEEASGLPRTRLWALCPTSDPRCSTR